MALNLHHSDVFPSNGHTHNRKEGLLRELALRDDKTNLAPRGAELIAV